jgi:hypothetical protein
METIHLYAIKAQAKGQVHLYPTCNKNTVIEYANTLMHNFYQVSGHPGWLKVGFTYIPAINVKLDPHATTHQGEVRYTSEKVFLRETPDSSNTKCYVDANAPVVVIDTFSNDNYIRIATSEGIGWVPASGIKLELE